MLQLVRAGARAWLRPTGCQGLSSLAEEAARATENPEQVASEGLPEPVLRKVELPVPTHRRPVQAWVESLRGFEQERVGLADLHPDVFATAPRLDILHQVAMWQKNFKRISYAKTKTRAEVRGGGRKPWPQKGTGRARHGSIRSPLWRGGGVAHGPRGPTSYYYMLPMKVRALGLKVALTVKLAQDDLHIMDSLELPTGDPQYLTELAHYRRWGDSVLLVDLTHEEMPQSIVEATSRLKTFNLIPAVATRWRHEPKSSPVPQPTPLAGFPTSLRMKAQVIRVARQALHDVPRHLPALPSFALGLPHQNGSQESQPGTGPSLALSQQVMSWEQLLGQRLTGNKRPGRVWPRAAGLTKSH
ncbi:large ribosomal subunit protein uL4m isoform X2 [Pan paniscus]|uniref:large ribosomal subunit protein uL4m isoform X2 n=1 Tax=Pan paniscus TaxID=9597 RepID=UPI0024366C52|nr:39S ribosomal protein L4, mitochondrial isoform X2 [Pan paniscus]